ncbi:hypothetical protein AAG906_017542 [Vitis piasezkii]
MDKSEVIPVGGVETLEDVAGGGMCVQDSKRSKGLFMRWWCPREKASVNWNLVYADKKEGGLGIRNLVALNNALLRKWSSRFAEEREPLWKQIIIEKFGVEEKGWCSRRVRGGYSVGV